MKRIFTAFTLLLFAAFLAAQAPGKLSYQAIVRTAGGELLKNGSAAFRIQILQATEFGAAIYVETHNVTTNDNGLATFEIGDGTVVTGSFDTIDWTAGPYYVKTEIDPTGGTNYSISGTSQLLSVPYALYAKKASLPADVLRLPDSPAEGDLLYYDGTHWRTLPAGNDGQVLTMANGHPKWIDALTGNELIPMHDPVLSIIFDDNMPNHNMHIASDGNYYYTCNGGNYTVGTISKFTLSGDSVTSYPVALDMRGLMYNKVDGFIYVSGFESNTSERNIYRITDLKTGTFEKLYPNLYDYNQACVALSDDGQYLYAFNMGTLKQYNLSDGILVNTLSGLNYGSSSGANGAVAVDPDYIYTWDPSSGTVYVYDHEGTFINSVQLSNGNYGFTLSWVNGYLFVAKDDNYSATGTWYGYNIRRSMNKSVIMNTKSAVSDRGETDHPKDSTGN